MAIPLTWRTSRNVTTSLPTMTFDCGLGLSSVQPGTTACVTMHVTPVRMAMIVRAVPVPATVVLVPLTSNVVPSQSTVYGNVPLPPTVLTTTVNVPVLRVFVNGTVSSPSTSTCCVAPPTTV